VRHDCPGEPRHRQEQLVPAALLRELLFKPPPHQDDPPRAPSPLVVLTNGGSTPLHIAELNYGSSSEITVFFRAATAAFNASNFVALEVLCSGSSPYLARELRKQAISLRAAVAIC